MRTLKGDKKKMSWLEIPGLEQHNRRMPGDPPLKRRSCPDHGFPNSQPSNRRKPRETESFPDEMGISLATSDEFDTTNKELEKSLTKSKWPEEVLYFPIEPETLLSNKRY